MNERRYPALAWGLAALVILLGLAAAGRCKGIDLASFAAGQPLGAAAGPALGVHTLPADDTSLALAREAGVAAVVDLFSWREIEPTEGQFHWQRPDEIVNGAEYYDLELVVRVDQHPHWASAAPDAVNAPPDDLADYIRFLANLAQRYKGRVKGYVIWNEPNLARDWGNQPPDPAAYAAMLCAAYDAIKRADPRAEVVSAGLAPTNHDDREAMDDRAFLRGLYAAGAKGCFDVLGAHPYGFAYPPDDSRGAHDGLNMARIEDLRQIMAENGDSGKRVWATEVGWTVAGEGDDAWLAVSAQQQADYLAGAVARAAADWPWLRLIAVWNLNGHTHPDWSGYSLLDAEGRPRPAYDTLKNLAQSRPQPRSRRSSVAARLGPTRDRSATVLAPDTVIHLGDSDFGQPWMPLYGNRNPSTSWEGLVYVSDPGPDLWQLTLRLMQSNVPNNGVWVNGQRLQPPFPPEDFSGSWVSVTYPVPAQLLQPGPNRIGVTIGRTLPLLQDDRFAWDDLQIKDVILTSPAPSASR